MKLVKFFALAVAAGAMFTACEPNEPNRPNGPADFEQAESKVYVDVTATGWENCNAWAWTEGGENYTGGESAAWPGLALETIEEIDGVKYYVWTAPAKVDGMEIGFIANNGTEQTVDLKITPNSGDGVFVKLTEKADDGKWLASINGAETEKPEPKPEPVLVLGDHTWGLIGSFNEWSADVAMEIANGWAVGTITVDAGAEFKVRADGDWADSYGFAATEEMPAFPVDGTQFTATYNGGNLKVDEAGTYEVSFTIEGENEYFKVLKK